jgi:hypothetical protein
MTAAAENCGTCRFYQMRDIDPAAAERARAAGIEVAEGQCRRYPAALRKLPHDWCGEHKPREAQ